MKTVLIPTDFTLASLNIVKQAASYFSNEKIKVVLFHALHTPADIHDLLFMNSRVPHEKITEDFRHACAALKKKHNDVIVNISFKHLYGNTGPVFRNFIEAYDIDLIFMPDHIHLQSAYPNSVEVRSLFKNAPVAFITSLSANTRKVFAPSFSQKLVPAEG